MEHIRLFVKGLSYSQTQSGAYALVLGEEGGERRLPIIIGGFEAQSIAIAIDKDMNPPRPLTHDLFKNFSDAFKIQLKQVVIHKLEDGVFYSILICELNGIEQVLDARTSDAVALAIRFNAPIFTYAEILDNAGVILNEKSTGSKSSRLNTKLEDDLRSKDVSDPSALETLSLEDLNKSLEEAVLNEDYERAVRIRDEIDRREAK
jgi:bifunctional DNase/RNase